MAGQKVDVKFEEWLKNGFELFKENIGLLVGSTAVVIGISVVSVGILAGPMMAGLIWIVMRLLDKTEPKPGVGDVFNGFSYFLPTFLFVLAIGAIACVVMAFSLIPCIGAIFAMVSPILFLAINVLFIFFFFLVVEQNKGIVNAAKGSLETVTANIGPWLAFALLTGVIWSAGGMACFVGVLFTMPMAICMQAYAYRAAYPRSVAAAQTVTPQAGSQPPAQ